MSPEARQAIVFNIAGSLALLRTRDPDAAVPPITAEEALLLKLLECQDILERMEHAPSKTPLTDPRPHKNPTRAAADGELA